MYLQTQHCRKKCCVANYNKRRGTVKLILALCDSKTIVEEYHINNTIKQ